MRKWGVQMDGGGGAKTEKIRKSKPTEKQAESYAIVM